MIDIVAYLLTSGEKRDEELMMILHPLKIADFMHNLNEECTYFVIC